MSAVRTASTVLKKDFMKEVLILLGTNLGDKRENLAKAIESIGRFGKIDRTSAHYESPAWGYESNASYLNQVLLLHTAMEPELLMQGLLAVEQELGRERLTEGYADRLIDIDILSIDAWYSKQHSWNCPIRACIYAGLRFCRFKRFIPNGCTPF